MFRYPRSIIFLLASDLGEWQFSPDLQPETQSYRNRDRKVKFRLIAPRKILNDPSFVSISRIGLPTLSQTPTSELSIPLFVASILKVTSSRQLYRTFLTSSFEIVAGLFEPHLFFDINFRISR